MIKNYFKIAWRNLWRHKLFTLINIIGLSIGISAALVIYLIVRFDFTFDKFHQDSDRIYRVVTDYTFFGEPSNNRGVSGALPGAVKNQVTGVEVTAPFFTLNQPNVFIPGKGNEPVKFKNQDNIVLVNDQYFKIFNYKWLVGTPAVLNNPNRVVLTSEQAKLYFPNLAYNQMVGKVISYDTIKTTISGIVETLTERTDFPFKAFIAYTTGATNKQLTDKMHLDRWHGTTSSSQLFVKLLPQTAAVNVESQLNALLKNNAPMRPEDKGTTRRFSLQQLSDVHFNGKYGTSDTGGPTADKNTLFGLLFIALFLLLLGCINFINLTTAQAAQRGKEIGIRKTMGSSRTQLIVQFLNETFLITLFAVIISVILSPVILKLFADFINKGVKVDFLHQPGLIVFLLGLTVAVGLLSGFYPAIMLSGYKPISVLKNQPVSGKSQTRNAWFRKSLTVTQFVIAQFFIMATIMVSKQVYYILHKDLGFKKDAIVIVNTPWKNRQASVNQVFMNKLKAIPQVELVSVASDPPSSENTISADAVYIDGKKEIKTEVEQKFADENYTRLYKIKLIAGRNLQMADSSGALLINATYAGILGFKTPQDAVGKYVSGFLDKKKMQIAGVVADFYERSLHTPIKPLAIQMSSNANTAGNFQVALKPQTTGGNEWKTAIASIQKSWKELYPDDGFEYHFFDDNIAQFYNQEQHTITLLNWATGLSILISCLGLLGLAIYTTSQRTKEIGVRKVLGASVAQIVTLLSTELVILILLAFVLVTPIAWYAMYNWMQGFSDRTSISWWIFALSGTGMLMVAVFTSAFQTIKAAITNPVKSLRSE